MKKIELRVQDTFTRDRNVSIDPKCSKCGESLIGNNTLREISYKADAQYMSIGRMTVSRWWPSMRSVERMETPSTRALMIWTRWSKGRTFMCRLPFWPRGQRTTRAADLGVEDRGSPSLLTSDAA